MVFSVFFLILSFSLGFLVISFCILLYFFYCMLHFIAIKDYYNYIKPSSSKTLNVSIVRCPRENAHNARNNNYAKTFAAAWPRFIGRTDSTVYAR